MEDARKPILALSFLLPVITLASLAISADARGIIEGRHVLPPLEPVIYVYAIIAHVVMPFITIATLGVLRHVAGIRHSFWNLRVLAIFWYVCLPVFTLYYLSRIIIGVTFAFARCFDKDTQLPNVQE